MEFSFFSDSLDFFVNRLVKREIDLSVKHIIITPKAYSLFFEQALSRQGGYFDIEVLSFSRLYYKLGGMPLLPYESAVIEVKKILKSVKLSCFSRSHTYSGFSKKMLASVYRLIESGIEPRELNHNSLKLKDLKQVYEQFVKRNPQRLAVEMERLIKNSNYFDNAHVYALNFASFNADERKILEFIRGRALSVSVPRINVPALNEISIKSAEIYAAYSRAQGLKAAARRVKKALNEGISLNEMCLVCDESSFLTAKRIFHEFDIEVYCDYKEGLKGCALCQYILLLLRFSFSRRDFLTLAKSPFSGIDAFAAAKLENYCNKFNIDYNFLKVFELGEQKELEIAEKARKMLVEKVNSFNLGLKARGAAFLTEFIERAEDDPSKTRMLEILQLIGDDDDFKELFIETAGAAFLRPLPRSNNCLIASSTDSFRGKRFKRVFIVDFNEGLLPKNITDFGVLDARESAQINLCPSMDELKKRAENDIVELLYLAEHSFLCYVRSPSQRPSPLLYIIKERVKNLIVSRYDSEQEMVYAGNDYEFLADFVATKSGGLEHLLLNLNRQTTFTSSLYSLLSNRADKIKAFINLKSSGVNVPIFDTSCVSASRLASYFDCPYKHFIKYGLRAKENEIGGISALDTGLIIHKVAQEFFLDGFNEENLTQIIKQALSDYLFKIEPLTAKKLENEIKTLCLRLKNNLFCSSFEPLGAEISLDDPKLNPVFIDDARLIGSIDYADVFRNYVRVIDYKSGGKVGFDSKSLYYGLKLQLPLYMFALIKNGYNPAAFVYYSFRLRWNSENRFVGVFNNDPNVVFALDNGLKIFDETKIESKVFSASVKKSGDKIMVTGSGCRSGEAIKAMCDYAASLGALALKQIKMGNIEPNPYNLYRCSCDFCDYKTACGFKGQPRELSSIKGGF